MIRALLVVVALWSLFLMCTMSQPLTTKGSDILGTLKPKNNSPLTRWMAPIPDSAFIESLSIPGTHDAAACKSKSTCPPARLILACLLIDIFSLLSLGNYQGPNNANYNCQACIPFLVKYSMDDLLYWFAVG